MRCVRHIWRNGPLPEARLSKVCGNAWEAVKACAAEYEGGLSFSWLEDARTDAQGRSKRASIAGVASFNSRSTDVQQPFNGRSTDVLSISKSKSGSTSKSTSQEGKERAHEAEIIPAGVSVELWDGLKRWGQYRKEKGNKLTPTGRAALLKKCLAMGDARSLAAIDHSIAQGWTGMYEPKEQQTNGPITEDSREQRRRMVVEANAKFYRERDAANGN